MKTELNFHFSLTILIAFCAVFFQSEAIAQGWFRSYPANLPNVGGFISSAESVPGGDFVFAGFENPGGLIIGRVDPQGEVLWKKTIPYSQVLNTRMAITASGNITVVFMAQYLPDKYNTHLLQTDSLGNVLWDRVNFPDSLKRQPRGGLVQLSDGGFLFTTGASADSNALIRTDKEGNFKWKFKFKEPDASSMGASDIDVDANGRILLALYVSSIDFNQNRRIVRQLDSTGNVLWQKTFNTSFTDPYTIDGTAYASDGSVLISGAYQDSFFIQKLTASGDSLWRTNVIPVRSYPFGSHLAPTNDGGGTIAWYPSPIDKGFYDSGLSVGKCTSNGVVEWSKNFPAPPNIGTVGLLSIAQSLDGGYILGGHESKNALLIRLDADGDTVTKTVELDDLKAPALFPNPITNGATLHFPNASTGVFEIFEITGKRVFRLDFEHSQVSLEGSSLSPGMYFYQIWDKTNLVSSGKLMVI